MLPNTDLRETFLQLLERDVTLEERLKLYKKLLKSDSVVAQGIAFDQFVYMQTLERWGISNPYLQFSEQLLGKAREQLKSPPVTAVNQRKTTLVGANHASALEVIAHVGQEDDISLIEPVLRSSSDVNVIYAGCSAARKCLSNAESVYPEIISTLNQIIFNEEHKLELRTTAVRAFDEYRVLEVEEVLIKAASQCPLPISADAAWILGIWDFQKHLALLQELSNAWPEEAMYPASEVRSLLMNNS